VKTIQAFLRKQAPTKGGWRLAATAIAVVLGMPNLPAQTQVDLRTQSKSVDFSSAPSTKPMQTGTVLPSVCSIGQQFFDTGAPAGQNLYGCPATNAWVLEAGGSGGGGGGDGLPSQTGTAGYLTTNGSAASWGNITTGGSGALDCATVPGQCDLVTAIVPFKASANTWTGLNDFSGTSAFKLPPHLLSIGAVPAVTSCGTSPSITSASTDAAGTLTEGASATGCTVTFAATFAATPSCVVTAASGLAFSYSKSTTAVVITNIGALSGTQLDYRCQ
jgi:hypothetical protein